MGFPKWRHHPTLASVIIYTEDQEVSITPDPDGWRDDRCFDVPVDTSEPERVKLKPGPKPKVKE